MECVIQSWLLASASPFQGRGAASCSFSMTLFLNSGAALSVRSWSHLTVSPQLWEIPIVQEMPYPGQEMVKPGVCGLWSRLPWCTGNSEASDPYMENEEKARRALPCSSAFQHKEGCYFEGGLHKACWHTSEAADEVRNQRLRSYEEKASKKENGKPTGYNFTG